MTERRVIRADAEEFLFELTASDALRKHARGRGVAMRAQRARAHGRELAYG
jgi:hypothetical protein